MTHTYKISGMTCEGCKAKVSHLLGKVKGVEEVKIDLEKGEATLSMSKHVDTVELKEVLKDYPKYQLSEKEHDPTPQLLEENQRTWFETYKPVLLIFGYITTVTLLLQLKNDAFQLRQWMNQFMAGFFLVFSFFKLLNIKGFAESYAMYDIIAKRWNFYGYIYAFIELFLGIAYLLEIFPVIVNGITLIVMSISLIGVLQSVLNKAKIKCACLGDVFNLPMSTITIIEDGLMIVMSIFMLLMD